MCAEKNCEHYRKDGCLTGCIQGADVSDSPEFAGYVPQKEYDELCEKYDRADELIGKLYDSGCLDDERLQLVKDFIFF